MLNFQLSPKKRFNLINSSNLPNELSININGPCINIVQDDLSNHFELYFADHRGKFIRRAISDNILGPFKIKLIPELTIDYLSFFTSAHNHIASPFIFLFKNEIWMVVHAPCSIYNCQRSFFFKFVNSKWMVLASDNFLPFYAKSIVIEEQILFICKGGDVFKSQNPIGPYEKIGNIFNYAGFDTWHNYDSAARHFGLFYYKREEIIIICFSRIGVKQESIEYLLMSSNDLINGSFSKKEYEIKKLLYPVKDWEGAHLDKTKSKAGASDHYENALRDPDLFLFDNNLYLFYSFGGERGIGAVQIAKRL